MAVGGAAVHEAARCVESKMRRVAAIILGVGRRTREPFGRFLCTGVALLFLTQVFVNTAVAVGLLPIAGLTLPLVSYGGSSLIVSFIALGLVLDVGARRIRVFGRPH